MDRKQASQVTTGLLLIVIGLVFLGQRLDILPDVDFRRLWPVVLIFAGLAKIMSPDDGRRRGGGAWMVFMGVLFLLHTYQLFRLDDSWPLFIVAAGVSMLVKRRTVMVAPVRSDSSPDSTGFASGGAPPQGDSRVL